MPSAQSSASTGVCSAFSDYGRFKVNTAIPASQARGTVRARTAPAPQSQSSRCYLTMAVICSQEGRLHPLIQEAGAMDVCGDSRRITPSLLEVLRQPKTSDVTPDV